MTASLHAHFKDAHNKRLIHLEQLRNVRNDPETDEATRRRLDSKIAYEQRQLQVIDDIWDVG